MKVLTAYARFLDVLTKIIRVIITLSLSAMVLIMAFQTVMRYVFHSAQPWCEELTCYLGVATIMLALGIASRSESHLQVDFLIRLYGPRMRCLVSALFSAAAVVVMIIVCIYTVSLMGHAVSVSATLPIKMSQVYAIFLTGSAILALYSVEVTARNLIGFFHNGEVPVLSPEKKEGGACE